MFELRVAEEAQHDEKLAGARAFEHPMLPIRKVPGLCWVLLISRLLPLEGMTAILAAMPRARLRRLDTLTLGRLADREQRVADKHPENSPLNTAAGAPACGTSQNAHGFRNETCRAHSHLVISRTLRRLPVSG